MDRSECTASNREWANAGCHSPAALQLDCDQVQLPVLDAEPLGEANDYRERTDTGMV